MHVLFILSAALTLFVMLNATSLHVYWQIIAYCLLLFSVCMLCHGELYLLRPDCRIPDHVLSDGFHRRRVRRDLRQPDRAPHLQWLLGIFRWPGNGHCDSSYSDPRSNSTKDIPARARFVFVVFALVTVMLTLLSTFFSGALYSKRNFYGVIRVRQIVPDGSTEIANVMSHGITVHGLAIHQILKCADVLRPIMSRDAGAGLALLNHPRYGHNQTRWLVRSRRWDSCHLCTTWRRISPVRDQPGCHRSGSRVRRLFFISE